MPRKHKPLPPLDVLQEWFSYDLETGIITTRKTRGAISVGKEAGTIALNGYIYINFRYQRYLAHRLAWMLHYGVDPGEMQVDHIDRNCLNNRIDNLRLATNAENTCNSKIRTTNRSGVKGVIWNKRAEKWVAKIHKDGVSHWIGTYDTIEEAAVAISGARQRLHGEFARSEQNTALLRRNQDAFED